MRLLWLDVSMFKLVDEMMRSEFEKLFESQRSYRSSDKEAFIRGCEAAFKHQQSKVDELQANFDQHDQWLGQRNRDVQELSDIIAKHAAEKDELQNRVDLLEGKIKEALNTVYAMKGKADCDHLTDKEQSFVYGFGYELHEILKEEQALKAGEV